MERNSGALRRCNILQKIAATKVTVGDYLAAAEAVFDRKPKTFRLYATYFRRIVAEIFGIDGGKARWDYRAGGRDEWVKRINAVRLAAIAPAKLQEWRVAFIKRASDPAACASAIRTSNSYLRCARCLFSQKMAQFVSEKLELPDPLPFVGLKIERARAPKYQGRIDVPVLTTAARNELRRQIRTRTSAFYWPLAQASGRVKLILCNGGRLILTVRHCAWKFQSTGI